MPPGPVTIDVDVLRDGRNASQVAADLRVPGVDGPALRVHGVFGVAHDTDLAFQDVRFPEVPLPAPDRAARRSRPSEPVRRDQLPPADRVAPVSPLDDPGQGQFAVVGAARSNGAPDGSLDPLMLAVHGDVLGPAVGRALGPHDEPACSWCCRSRSASASCATPVTPWVLQEIEAWHVGDGYATGPARLWDEERGSARSPTQTAHLRTFKPDARP